MRIVQLANFYSTNSGGLRRAVDRWGAGYAAAGHSRLLIVPGPVDRQVCTEAGERLEVGSPLLPQAGGYRVIVRHGVVRRALARFRPDVLEVSDQLTLGRYGRWARRAGCGAVLFAHERADVVLPARFTFVADVHHRRLGELFDAVVCASRSAALEWARAGVCTSVVPLGVDLDVFQPLSQPPERPTSLPIARPQLICVTRLSREKRPDVAIGILAVLRARGVEADLTLIGDGPRRQALVEQARRLPVRFLGHVPDQLAISQLVAMADVCIAPGPYETFGLAALESLACGTPVVAPPSSAVVEMLRGAAGNVAVHPEAPAMADATEALLRIDRERSRREARTVAERFPWPASVKGMLSVLDAAANGAAKLSRPSIN